MATISWAPAQVVVKIVPPKQTQEPIRCIALKKVLQVHSLSNPSLPASSSYLVAENTNFAGLLQAVVKAGNLDALSWFNPATCRILFRDPMRGFQEISSNEEFRRVVNQVVQMHFSAEKKAADLLIKLYMDFDRSIVVKQDMVSSKQTLLPQRSAKLPETPKALKRMDVLPQLDESKEFSEHSDQEVLVSPPPKVFTKTLRRSPLSASATLPVVRSYPVVKSEKVIEAPEATAAKMSSSVTIERKLKPRHSAKKVEEEETKQIEGEGEHETSDDETMPSTAPQISRRHSSGSYSRRKEGKNGEDQYFLMERLFADLHTARSELEKVSKERDSLRSENERLQAQIKQMQENGEGSSVVSQAQIENAVFAQLERFFGANNSSLSRTVEELKNEVQELTSETRSRLDVADSRLDLLVHIASASDSKLSQIRDDIVFQSMRRAESIQLQAGPIEDSKSNLEQPLLDELPDEENEQPVAGGENEVARGAAYGDEEWELVSNASSTVPRLDSQRGRLTQSFERLTDVELLSSVPNIEKNHGEILDHLENLGYTSRSLNAMLLKLHNYNVEEVKAQLARLSS